MGQRTQILVLKENNKGERKAYFFHHQWGYGRNMYLTVMDIQTRDYFKETFAQGYSFLTSPILGATDTKWYDITKDISVEVLNAVDPDNFKSITDVFAYGDNDNGGIFVYIKEDEVAYHGANIKIGFLLGDEDEESVYDGKLYNEGNGKAFERWLTPAEYGRMNGGSIYSDPDFIAMFTQFCDYFGIEHYEPTAPTTADKE